MKSYADQPYFDSGATGCSGNSLDGYCHSMERDAEMAKALGRGGQAALAEHRALVKRAREAALRVLGANPETASSLESDDCPTERCIAIVSEGRKRIEELE